MNELSRRNFFVAAGSVAGASLIHTRDAAARQVGVAAPAITLAFTEYLRFTPLATGDVQQDDLELIWVRGPRSEMLRRAASDPDVDGGEGSMLGHLLRVDRGDRSLVAVPVFLLRNFTSRDLYTLKGSSLTPTSLNGRRIGIYNWAASGATWYRHLLRYLGQDPYAVEWVVGGPDTPTTVTHRVPLPSHVTAAPPDKSLSDLLLAGDLDAFFAPLPPSKYDLVDGPIVRVVPDFRSLEKRYYSDTGYYPPQHVLLLRRQVWERNPAVDRQLVDIFERCEARFVANQRLFPYSTPWLIGEVEETERLMGEDYHAHGLEKNRDAVDAFCQSAFDDGLTQRRVTVEEYFAEFLRA
jgi:4,5-dihydroxyphthalate decarboxylase